MADTQAKKEPTKAKLAEKQKEIVEAIEAAFAARDERDEFLESFNVQAEEVKQAYSDAVETLAAVRDDTSAFSYKGSKQSISNKKGNWFFKKLPMTDVQKY